MKLLIDKHELARLLGITERAAAKVINQVRDDMERCGFYVVSSKTPKAPRRRVLELLGLEEKEK